MTLLEPESLPAPNPWPKRLLLVLVPLLLAGGIAAWQLRFYAEKQQVRRFMDLLVAGDYRAAYQQWKPSPAYTFQDFVEDWGESNSWGRLKSYEIVAVEPPTTDVVLRTREGGRGVEMGGESSGVVVSVRLNGLEPPVRLWVERSDLSLSFPPF